MNKIPDVKVAIKEALDKDISDLSHKQLSKLTKFYNYMVEQADKIPKCKCYYWPKKSTLLNEDHNGHHPGCAYFVHPLDALSRVFIEGAKLETKSRGEL